ncbi:MAG: type III-A CRISPR-associated protein Csm2 [Candidatus Poribacteria bacterium]|nr:type III-A CRISPR-associated protein Csm2 [Candidatus Poribacteria bacterium]
MNIFETRIKPQLEKGSFGSIDPQTLVESAEQIGQKLSSNEDGLKNHQLRKFYDTVKQIERRTLSLKRDAQLPDELLAQLLFLRPHLANAERKQRTKDSIQLLRRALDPCLTSEALQTKADLTQFVKFFEAIVAYAR